MPISRDRARHHLESITLDFPGTSDTLTVWFNSNIVSPAAQREVQRLRRRVEAREIVRETVRAKALANGEMPPDDDAGFEEEERQASVGMLLRLIDRWDMLEREPTEQEPNPPTVPITMEELDNLPLGLTNRIAAAISKVLQPDPTTSTPTEPTSAPKDDVVPSLNGSYT